MSIIDRIILSIYTILLMLLSLISILLSVKILPQDYWQQGLTLIYGRWEAALIGGVFFLVSIRLLMAGVRSRRGPHKIVHQTEMGVVEISIGAVEDLIAKTARHTRGVRNAKVHIRQLGEEVKVDMRIVVGPEYNIPKVAGEIQQRTQEYLKNTVGVTMTEVRIMVNDISNEFKSKTRVD
jgi:uncharacterized alkaline shock family protein YloU